MRFPLLVLMLSVGCAHRHVETGEASWYGKDFRGNPTASGETFRPSKRTAAHKTLPLGTVVVVRRMDTGDQVRVVINDRGPYAHGRIIDLSKRAARRIDMLDDGAAQVRIKAVGCKQRYGGCN
jgi:rare lipoprotein A